MLSILCLLKLRDLPLLKDSILDKSIKSSSFLKTPDPPEYDAVIISDLHLGSSVCRDKHIIEFLEKLERSEVRTRRLILNGDVFDSIDFRRLNKRHWKVLSLVRKLSDRIVITWVCGNHDGPADPISHILGVQVREEYEFRSGNKLVLVLHGHQFDNFIATYPTITLLADLVYRFLQAIDTTHRFARFAKTNTKVFLRCIEKIRVESVAYAASKDVDVVCCGHTHHAETMTGGPVEYFNSGCWTESPSTFLTVHNGVVRLEIFTPALAEAPAASTDSPSLAGGVAPGELVFN
jgi:UDP-2,3-diacylglucosamine pyrophosphatase LpxH